jgi:hypothetical protein
MVFCSRFFAQQDPQFGQPTPEQASHRGGASAHLLSHFLD